MSDSSLAAAVWLHGHSEVDVDHSVWTLARSCRASTLSPSKLLRLAMTLQQLVVAGIGDVASLASSAVHACSPSRRDRASRKFIPMLQISHFPLKSEKKQSARTCASGRPTLKFWAVSLSNGDL